MPPEGSKGQQSRGGPSGKGEHPAGSGQGCPRPSADQIPEGGDPQGGAWITQMPGQAGDTECGWISGGRGGGVEEETKLYIDVS